MKPARWLPTLAAVLAVFCFYAFIGSGGTFRFQLVSADSYYGSLSEGFLHGQLSMIHEPSPRLAGLRDPYSVDERMRAGVPFIWDASYFEGKYYLYFSAVPALLLHIPVRLVTGAYPSDRFAGTLFASIAFLLFAMVLHRALPASQIPLWFWVLFAGVGSTVPAILVGMHVYEVPIALAVLFTAGFAYALLRYCESKSVRSALAMGICLGLAIASRPDLGVLLPVAALVVVSTKRRRFVVFLLPLIAIGSAVMLYNYARFHSPFEFGICYQLNVARPNDCAQCSLRNRAEVLRLANETMHYVFWAPAIFSEFPYFEIQRVRLDPAVSFKGRTEPLVGIATVTPFVLIGTLFAGLLVLRRAPLDPAQRAGAILVLCGWVVLLGLASCRWMTIRFMLEFTWLMVVGGVICTESALVFLESAGVATRPLRIAIVVLCTLSILAGAVLPYSRQPW